MSFVEVEPGVRLYVQDLGAGSPVVFVAGFGLSHQVWEREVAILTERGHRVICVDQRGHGRSDKPLHGYSVARLADDLLRVLDELEVAEATLVGWSFGGHTVFGAAATAPERVARLVLVGSNGVRASRSDEYPFGRTADQLLEPLLDAELRDRFGSRRDGIKAAFATDPDPWVLDWLTSMSMDMPTWVASACYRSMLEVDLVAEIPGMSVPILQLVGTADPVFSLKGARWLNERLANATLIELDGCGHYPMIEQPDAFDRALLEFIEGRRQPAASKLAESSSLT